jgi:hypothetical protein
MLLDLTDVSTSLESQEKTLTMALVSALKNPSTLYLDVRTDSEVAAPPFFPRASGRNLVHIPLQALGSVSCT